MLGQPSHPHDLYSYFHFSSHLFLRVGQSLCWQPLSYRMRYSVQVNKQLSWLAEGLHMICSRMLDKEMILSRADKTICLLHRVKEENLQTGLYLSFLNL